MNHDDIDGDNYKDKKDFWLPYVKMDVLSTSYCYARFCGSMVELIGFSIEDCLSLPRLGFKNFNSLRTAQDEPIYTYNDKHMRWFVRQAAHGGRVWAFNQYYISKICDDILNIISENLNVKGNIYNFIEVYMDYKNKHFKVFEKEYEDQFGDYRNENEEEKETFINKKLCNLPIHHLLKQINLFDLLWDFDCTSLYPSAMWDVSSIYPNIETGYASTRDMNDELVQKFNIQTFTQESAILKNNNYNPKKLIVQHLPVKEKVKNIECNLVRNGYIT